MQRRNPIQAVNLRRIAPNAPITVTGRAKDTGRGRDRAVSFRALDAMTARVAEDIASCGIGSGDGVLILHPMAIELYVFLIALFRLGAVGMFLDPSAGRKFIEHCISIYAPRAFFGSWKAQMLRLWVPPLYQISPSFCTSLFPATHLISIDGLGSSARTIAEVDDSAPALITFTSGSTGQPKAALRTHGFLIAQHRALQESLSLGQGCIDLATLPIFVLANLASGVTSVLPDADMRSPGKIEALPVLEQIERHSVTTTAASPAFIRRLTAECMRSNKSMPQLKQVFMRSAGVSIRFEAGSRPLSQCGDHRCLWFNRNGTDGRSDSVANYGRGFLGDGARLRLACWLSVSMR
jgi:acyl-coenzyme A synthetase/AMP-(fatty) acid ligase